MSRKPDYYWTNRFVAWVDNLPIPPAAFYVALLVAMGVLSILYGWSIGSIESGSFDLLYFLTGFWLIEAIAIIHFLIRSSKQAFDEFAPLLKLRAKTQDELRAEFSHLPRNKATLVAVVGALFGAFMTFYPPMAAGVWERPLLLAGISWIASQIFVFEYFYRLLHQLRYVRKLYATIPEINIFYLGPVHSLAGFSARAGVAILFFAYINPAFVLMPNILSDPIFVVLSIVFTGTAFAAFVIPLMGVRKRISAEKEDLLKATGIAINRLRLELQSCIKEMTLDNVGHLRQALGTQIDIEQKINSISIWPWSTAVFRGFLSAVLLPILLWIAQQYLSGLLSF